MCVNGAIGARGHHRYKEWLEDCEMIFAIPGYNLTVAQVSQLRRTMPEGTQVSQLTNKKCVNQRVKFCILRCTI
jgi:hypothetical protein